MRPTKVALRNNPCSTGLSRHDELIQERGMQDSEAGEEAVIGLPDREGQKAVATAARAILKARGRTDEGINKAVKKQARESANRPLHRPSEEAGS